MGGWGDCVIAARLIRLTVNTWVALPGILGELDSINGWGKDRLGKLEEIVVNSTEKT